MCVAITLTGRGFGEWLTSHPNFQKTKKNYYQETTIKKKPRMIVLRENAFGNEKRTYKKITIVTWSLYRTGVCYSV